MNLKVTARINFGYVRPFRCAWNRRIERGWVRYLIIRELTIESHAMPQTIIGRTWTKRGAIRVVDKLRRMS